MCLSLLLSFSSGFPKIRLNSERKFAKVEKMYKRHSTCAAPSYDAYNFSVEISRPLGIVLESIENSRGAIVAEVLEVGVVVAVAAVDVAVLVVEVAV